MEEVFSKIPGAEEMVYIVSSFPQTQMTKGEDGISIETEDLVGIWFYIDEPEGRYSTRLTFRFQQFSMERFEEFLQKGWELFVVERMEAQLRS